MQLITAIIQPQRLEPVHDALVAAGFTGLTVTEVKGHGAQAGRTEYYRGVAIHIDFRSKLRIELLVGDDRVDEAITTVLESARTGQIGDGKIWVTAVDRVIRVRTGETGEAAL